MTLGYLIRKEFKQFFRNPFLPKLVIAFPVMIMLVIPWIVNMDIKNIRLTVVDKDGSSTSGKLIRTLGASEYFILEDVTGSYPEALRQLEKGRTDAVVEIPGYFEQDLVSEGRTQVQISLNAVNQIKGALGSNYLNAVCADFFAENFAPVSVSPFPAPRVSISVQNKFNPYMDYKNFMIPAYMVIVIILLGGFLPALNIVGEKEKGTIEQINITPVRKTSFIFAKLIPYWVMGLIVLSICMLLAWAVYGLSPHGGICYLFSLLFIFALSGFGLIVSNYSDTMQQAMFVMLFFILVFMLMSGLLTPISSMPRWAQVITWLNPPRYFIEMMRGVYLQGCSLADLSHQLLALLGFDIFFGTWAVMSYRKTR